MGLLVVLAVLAPVICPYDPLEQNLTEFLKAPGAKHLFGTDQLGRDLFTRTLYAARTDLWIMVMAEIAPFIIGISLGMAAGYFGGVIDWLVGMASDTFIAFPFYLLVIVIAFASGAGSHGIFITYLLVGWLIYCKVARGQSAALKNSEWIAAAKILGYSDIRILFCELLPNIIPQAIVLLMTDMVGLLCHYCNAWILRHWHFTTHTRLGYHDLRRTNLYDKCLVAFSFAWYVCRIYRSGALIYRRWACRSFSLRKRKDVRILWKSRLIQLKQ